MDKVTNWYPAKINPVRKGWYECHYAGEQECTMRRYWDGHQWLTTPGGNPLSCAFGVYPRDKWRGLTIHACRDAMFIRRDLCAAQSADGK